MIALTKVRLVNWYAFNLVNVPIGEFTLIAGRNGNGKSVFLDAIKYALYGDTVFNKSTDNKGSRTISSYTRGLLDATAVSYMRPADKFPNVYTHIVLEFYEKELDRLFVLGTVIETSSSNSISTQRYVIEGKSIDEIEHTYQEGDNTYVYTATELQRRYGLKMMQVADGLAKFMQRTGLRLNEQQLAAFRRKLRSIMSYDPNAKIDQFIRKSVLEEKKVDFSKLVGTKNNIDVLTKTFESIEKEMKELDSIIKHFESLNKAKNMILEDDMKIAYKNYLYYHNQIETELRNIEATRKQIEKENEKLKNLSEAETTTRNLWNSAESNLRSLDCAKAIMEAQEALNNAEKRKLELKKQRDKLLDFQRRISELIAWSLDKNKKIEGEAILSSLTIEKYSGAEKESSVAGFLSQLKDYRDKTIGNIALKNNALTENENKQNICNRTIEDCNAKKATFSTIPDYVGLKNEINKEFEKRGINSKACFACEYVIGLSDESWRNTIEGYLGRRRYTILVEPQYYNIADDILNSTKYKYAHLFNTRLLMKKDIKPENDSVVQFIDIKNTVAQKYFEFQLGRFHATTKEKVREFENAMSKEGRVAVSMDSYYINFDSIKFFCLGQETLEINKVRAQKQLEKLQDEESHYREQIKALRADKSYLDTEINLFGDYNYDAVGEYSKAETSYQKKKTELYELKEAQKNNKEFIQLSETVDRYKKEHASILSEIDTLKENRAKHNSEIDEGEEKLSKAEISIEDAKNKIDEYKIQNIVVYRKSKEAYNKYIENGKSGAGGLLKDREDVERSLEEAKKNLMTTQAAYNTLRTGINQLPVSEDSISEYRSRKDKIWLDDCQEIKEKLKEQTVRYEQIFKNEFVLTVLKSCESAKDDLKLINKELSNLGFKSQYEFDVNYVKDGSDYAQILKYAEELKKREDLGVKSDQMLLDAVTDISNDSWEELEANIKKIINRIVESNDKDKIEGYADYRNYMTYEIILTNDILEKSKLSKQSGFNSGAEVQIPYMLILLSAMLMIYNDKLNSTRLVFIDEPFAKMDPTNVNVMMEFMRSQKLQMIFCAPDKTELIGNKCEVVLPVLRSQPDLMEIGIVKLH